MRFLFRLASGMALCAAVLMAQDLKMVRSASGPSGRVDGAKFVFDEERNRFLVPQDKSLIVYFEWETQPGTHTLTAQWRNPDGRVEQISPDVKITATSKDMACYWTYLLNANMTRGIWTAEIRVDGRPAGAHSFEIAGAPIAAAPSVDDIFRTVSQALVTIRKLNAAGKRTDTAAGFVSAPNRITTALQCIDGATKIEIEFANGKRTELDSVLVSSRTADAAILIADTGNIVPLTADKEAKTAVGERLYIFNARNGAREIGTVDISAKRTIPGFGPRLQFVPSLGLDNAGGPLVDQFGKVVAILGGSTIPGARFDQSHTSLNPVLATIIGSVSSATPLTEIVATASEQTVKLSELLAAGVLTAPLTETPVLIYAVTAQELEKKADMSLPRDVFEFSRRDKVVYVFSDWIRRGKISKGMLSGKVFDNQNRLRVTIPPKKTSLSDAPTRAGFSFSPEQLPAGIYRVDVLWDDQPVWRSYIRIME